MGRAFLPGRSNLVSNSLSTNESYQHSGETEKRCGTRKEFAMVASNKTRRLVCTVVRVAERPLAEPRRFVRKPSALVPWADPYIASLVRQLQQEVRLERTGFADSTASSRRVGAVEMFDSRGAALATAGLAVSDLEPPSPVEDDWDWFDQPRWTVDGEPGE
jgi:hypothetical protein